MSNTAYHDPHCTMYKLVHGYKVALSIKFFFKQHAFDFEKHVFKGTVEPEWICMRVVPWDRP